ncbi:MAG: 1-(5-phosphoribosyl)-5-[Firmicutes bacterium]|nr:1-(5-phosphoribosyl)-5-[(5-phosphoribosylamino)methylideneamino]imidazole-4-carboxamide isomerase [Bacillota bacterium]
MLILPAIDLYEGKAVRLLKGDYAQMTVYSERPREVAEDFRACGAQWIHMVDLEGARDGSTPNFEVVADIARSSGLKVEIGGGIRSMQTVEQYLEAGVRRVILGTAAVKDPAFLKEAADRYGEHIAVGADLKDGYVAIRGWRETSGLTGLDFCRQMQQMGIRTLICTDIDKDGAMKGTNHGLYRQLQEELDLDLVASGGVSSLEDVRRLKAEGLYGAIIGKAYYTGAVDLREAIEVAK